MSEVRVLTESQGLLRDAAKLDPARVTQGRQFLDRVAAKASGLARRMARVWTAVLVVELVLGVVATWRVGATSGWDRWWTIGAIVAFGVLGLVLVFLIRLYGRIVRLPHAIEAASDKINALLADARTDYAAAKESAGWRGSVRMLFGAAKLLRALHKAMGDHEADANALTAAVVMANPGFWAANAVLAGVCVALPAVALAIAITHVFV
jgi:hypothetical protein